MRLTTLVSRELFERRRQLLTSFLAVFLGITAIVAIRNVTFFSEKAVARELDALGANVLILPKSVTVQDYFQADLHGAQIPEEYVTRLVLSDLQGLDNLSPKLSVPVEIQGHEVVLTGILPKAEFQAKAMWKGAGIFARPSGCGDVEGGGWLAPAPIQETLVRRRVVEDLAADEALVGADLAGLLGVVEGDTLQALGRGFRVIATLPETGTVDDARVFAHLHTVQELTASGSVVNAIEVVGCCSQISQGLVARINSLLPDAKVVTITQVVETQIRTNEMMARLSLIFLVIIVLVAGASIANYMYGNVDERRREIGTLMALGADSFLVVRVFLLKALVMGLAGGIGGALLGTALAVVLGPRLARVPVLPMPGLMLSAIGIAVVIALVASSLPARRAAGLDPHQTLQEI
ncbi:MAG: FtsX-like permease family protein [Candidatus Eisenbacteria bacterium]|nr:FtsX-like permease family protein [Candidatus Eisenbacteria bacterium]